MKKALSVLALVMTLGLSVVAMDAEAKRLGGGKSTGMNRNTTSAPANNTTGSPASPATAGAAAAAPAAGAAAAAGKRSWMGPLAGLAAGIGLMALASHLGFGEGLANMMMIALLVMVVLGVVAYFMRKRAAGNTPAMAGLGGMAGRSPQEPSMMRNGLGDQQPASPLGGGSRIGSALLGQAGAPAAAAAIPADFDVPAFIRGAKENFMRLQAANDKGDLEALRAFLTPELFEEARGEIAERGAAVQQTQVFGLEARVLEVVEEADRYIVSVRFDGSIREQATEEPVDLAEVWHLTKPRNGFGGWVIAGIQQA